MTFLCILSYINNLFYVLFVISVIKNKLVYVPLAQDVTIFKARIEKACDLLHDFTSTDEKLWKALMYANAIVFSY